MEKKEFYQFLLTRYAEGSATEEEINELFDELGKRQHDAAWTDIIDQVIHHSAKEGQYDEAYWHPVIRQILATKPVPAPVRKMKVKKWLVAASLLIMASVTLYLLYPTREKQPQTSTTSQDTPQVVPGRQGAILTLADASEVLLDTVKNGAVFKLEGGGTASVIDGHLVYNTQGAEISYNTVSTPKGRLYQVILPDGTDVWLNSGSSIRYPTSFAGEYRVVKITGEAYFEVKKNTQMPFRVELENGMHIQVVGTRFNVNAYNDEPSIKTTLLEGAVNIHKNGQTQRLVPGQQAEVSGDDKISVTEANVGQVIAWKDGLFDFNNRDLKSVLREIGRWYDLDIVYGSEPASGQIAGKMQRNLALTQVMETLKDLDISYRIEGRKLIISK